MIKTLKLLKNSWKFKLNEVLIEKIKRKTFFERTIFQIFNSISPAEFIVLISKKSCWQTKNFLFIISCKSNFAFHSWVMTKKLVGNYFPFAYLASNFQLISVKNKKFSKLFDWVRSSWTSQIWISPSRELVKKYKILRRCLKTESFLF